MMCLEVVNLSDWERFEESLGKNLQSSLASKEMMMSVGQTVITYTLLPTDFALLNERS